MTFTTAAAAVVVRTLLVIHCRKMISIWGKSYTPAAPIPQLRPIPHPQSVTTIEPNDTLTNPRLCGWGGGKRECMECAGIEMVIGVGGDNIDGWGGRTYARER